MVLCIVSHPTALFRRVIIWLNQQNLCQNTLFYIQQPKSTNTTFFNTCIIVSFQSFLVYHLLGRLRFSRWHGFWMCDITSFCVIWRHVFRRRSDVCMPLTCEHDVAFRHSCSGKRLSKALYYEVNVLNNGQSWLV